MADYTKTEHLGLDLYGDSDPADLRDGHNNNMRVLDEKVSQNIDDITATRGTVTDLGKRVTTLDTQKASHDDVAAAVATKADASAVYTKGEVDTKVATKADAANTYTKMEVDATQSTQNTEIGLKANSADVYTKAQSDENYAKREKRNIMVVFGDSYASNVDNSWAVELAGMTGLTLKNFAVSGAGYLTDDPGRSTFSQQADTAIADMSFDKNLVKYVFVAGGRNDTPDNTESDFSAAIRSLVTKIMGAYKNAQIIMIPILWDHRPVNGFARMKAAWISRYSRQVSSEVSCIDWAWTWLLGESQYFADSTTIHYNIDGTRIVARYIKSFLDGTYVGRHMAALIHSSNKGDWDIEIDATAGVITYSANFKADLDMSNMQNFADIPEWALPNGTTYGESGRRWVVMSTNGGAETTLLQVKDSGKFSIQPFVNGSLTTRPKGPAGFSFSAAW